MTTANCVIVISEKTFFFIIMHKNIVSCQYIKMRFMSLKSDWPSVGIVSHCWLMVVSRFEPPCDKTNKMACAPSEDSDQPGHPPSAQAVLSLRCPQEESLGPQLPIECTADAQADLSLRWAHMSFCWFCHDAAHS